VSTNISCVLTGESSMGTRTEADSFDITECSHDDKHSTGVLGLMTSDKGSSGIMWCSDKRRHQFLSFVIFSQMTNDLH